MIANIAQYSKCRGSRITTGFTTDQKSAMFARVLKYRRGYFPGEYQVVDPDPTQKNNKRSSLQDLVDGQCPDLEKQMQAIVAQSTFCPKPCNVHVNSCDATTAPTCIYPDPRASKPRAACACRPGYKASGYADGDTTKQWRLPILGQDHRVWVAEGVKCDAVCTGYGVDSCREVGEISKTCIG